MATISNLSQDCAKLVDAEQASQCLRSFLLLLGSKDCGVSGADCGLDLLKGPPHSKTSFASDAHLPNLKSTCPGCGIHPCRNIHIVFPLLSALLPRVTPNTGADTHAGELGIQQQQQSTDNKCIEA